MTQHAGQITTAGTTYDVEFQPADTTLSGRIDTAYRTKYTDSGYLPPMVSAGPQAATVEITPRTGSESRTASAQAATRSQARRDASACVSVMTPCGASFGQENWIPPSIMTDCPVM